MPHISRYVNQYTMTVVRATHVLALLLLLIATMGEAAEYEISACLEKKITTRRVCDQKGKKSAMCEAYVDKTIALCCPKDEEATSLCTYPEYFGDWLKTGITVGNMDYCFPYFI